MNALALDGVSRFHVVEKASVKKATILLRVTAIVRAILLLVAMLIKQVCRAVAFFVSGHIKEGSRDLVSVGVQCVALPLLGITAMFSPKKAEVYSLKLLKKLQLTLVEPQNPDFFEVKRNIPNMSETQAKVFRVVGGILAFSVVSSRIIIWTLDALLSDNVKGLDLKCAKEYSDFAGKAFFGTVTLGIPYAYSNDWKKVFEDTYEDSNYIYDPVQI